MPLEKSVLDSVWRDVRSSLAKRAAFLTHPQDADDLTQDTYLTAVSLLERYRLPLDTPTIRRWLLRILTFHCLNHCRKPRPQALPEAMPDGGPEIAAPIPCFDFDEDIAETSARVRALGHRRAEIWQMYLQGYNHAEMAHALGVSRPSVTRHLHIILENLKATRGDLITRSDGYTSAEAMFWDCARVTLYKPPSPQGSGLSYAKLKRMR